MDKINSRGFLSNIKNSFQNLDDSKTNRSYASKLTIKIADSIVNSANDIEENSISLSAIKGNKRNKNDFIRKSIKKKDIKSRIDKIEKIFENIHISKKIKKDLLKCNNHLFLDSKDKFHKIENVLNDIECDKAALFLIREYLALNSLQSKDPDIDFISSMFAHNATLILEHRDEISSKINIANALESVAFNKVDDFHAMYMDSIVGYKDCVSTFDMINKHVEKNQLGTFNDGCRFINNALKSDLNINDSLLEFSSIDKEKVYQIQSDLKKISFVSTLINDCEDFMKSLH